MFVQNYRCIPFTKTMLLFRTVPEPILFVFKIFSYATKVKKKIEIFFFLTNICSKLNVHYAYVVSVSIFFRDTRVLWIRNETMGSIGFITVRRVFFFFLTDASLDNHISKHRVRVCTQRKCLDQNLRNRSCNTLLKMYYFLFPVSLYRIQSSQHVITTNCAFLHFFFLIQLTNYDVSYTLKSDVLQCFVRLLFVFVCNSRLLGTVHTISIITPPPHTCLARYILMSLLIHCIFLRLIRGGKKRVSTRVRDVITRGKRSYSIPLHEFTFPTDLSVHNIRQKLRT